MTNGLNDLMLVIPIVVLMLPFLISILLERFMFDLQEIISFKVRNTTTSKILQFLVSKTYCRWCLGFWVTLLITGNIWVAIITSSFYYLIEKNI